jgi:arsenate reductase (glutaredoxin)
MKAKIYHNPACGTSRKTLEILEEIPGIDLTVIEYLKTPPTRDRLVELYAKAKMSARDGLRTQNSPAAELVAELGLDDADDNAILDAMMAHPVLINRPIVETEKGVRLCRPQDVIREILQTSTAMPERRRLRSVMPATPKPNTSMAQVDASGTAARKTWLWRVGE